MGNYRYVYQQQGNRLPWVAKPKTFRNDKCVNLPSRSFRTEEEAAIYVDEVFIANGMDPVNILAEKPAPGQLFDVREFQCWITG